MQPSEEHSDAPLSSGASVSLWDGLPTGPDGPAIDASTIFETPAGGVDPQVAAALESADSGLVDVIVRLQDAVDPAALAELADRAAAEAVTTARSHSDDIFDPAVSEAGRLARAELVVSTLREHGADQRADVIELLQAGPGDSTAINDLWVGHAVSGQVDTELLAELAARPEVESIRLDGAVELPEPLDEPLLPEWGLEKVQAPQTWGEYGYRGEGITVAVLDTGVDTSHPALSDRYRGRDGDHSDSWFVATGENYPTPGDGNGHGTHVAGSIAGGAPGEVVGVAPDAEYIAVKILTDGGTGSESGILSGMQWVLAPGGDAANAPHIANNSWGISINDDSFWDAVEAWRTAGIVPIFANGNDGPMPGTVGSPASYPHSFAVGSTDQNDAMAISSSRGPAVWNGDELIKPQVSAPGHQIRSAWPTDLGMDYRTISGTSMATPHVSGVAALVLQANPGLSVTEVETLLEQTARVEATMGEVPNNSFGYGIVDAFAGTTRAAHSGLVSGTVTGPDGPVAATVVIEELELEVIADAETGAFELWAPEGTYTMAVSAYGYLPVEEVVEVVEGEVTSVEITLSGAGPGEVSGTVTSDGDAIAGAEVRVLGESAVTWTDVDGSYALPLPVGSHRVRVLAQGFQPWVETVEVDAATTLDVSLEPLPAADQSGWPELKANSAGTGISQSPLDGASLAPVWTAKVPSVSFSSPVVSDDSVYIASQAGTFTALDRADGEVRWTITTGGNQRGTPAIHGDQVLLTTGSTSTLVSLDAADGDQQWSYDLGADLSLFGAPTVVDDTVIVAVGNDETGGMHAVDLATGEGIWRTDIGAGVFFGPAVDDGIAVAASTNENRITAIDIDTGEPVWELTDPESSLTSPLIWEGTVYLGTSTEDYESGSVLALDLATGDELWRTEHHGDTQGSSPVLYGDLVVLGSHSNGSVAAYERDSGDLAWHHFIGTAVTSSVAATTGGVIIGGSQDRSIFALDASSGEQLWSDEMPASILSSPAVSDELAIFVASDGTVTAYTSRGEVSGTVTGPDGPVAATVELLDTDESTTTDPETGEYLLEPPVGEHTLQVSAYGLSTHTEQITVTAAIPVVVDVTLSDVGNGSLAGVVTDSDGTGLEGASVELLGTPLDPVTTDADGNYELPEVAAGPYQAQVALPGYATSVQAVEVEADQHTTHDVALEQYELAVVADYEGDLTRILTDAGWRVDSVSFEQIDGTVDGYQTVILNGNGDDRADADLERLAAIADQADEAGVSLVVLDQWAPSYGSVGPFLEATGRAGSVHTQSSNRGEVWLTDPVPHEITEDIGDGRHQIIVSGNHGWLLDYEGASLVTIGADRDGVLGSGIGYERVNHDSSLVLLPSLAATAWAGPGRNWTSEAADLLVAAVEHADTAIFGGVDLTATGEGEPLDGVVSVVGSFERADIVDGTARLLLEPGEHTLRVQSLGMATVEVEVEVEAGTDVPVEVDLVAADTGAVSGVVRDASSGDPVAGIEVSVAELDIDPVTTDASGAYTLSDVPVGTYTLEADGTGFSPIEVPDVEVETGSTTTVDIDIPRAPQVAVVGDYQGRLSVLLDDNGIPAFGTGWEVTDDLSGVDVAVVNNPDNISGHAFEQHLAAFDEAGVSVLWPATNTASGTRGIHLLSTVTGNPEAIVGQGGGLNEPPIDLTELAEHPILAGLGTEPVAILNGGAEGPWFDGHSGYALAEVGLGGETGGPGVVYDVRTADSVHVLLSGLGSTVRNNPETTWTDDGVTIFLNAVRWAAAPQLAQVTGVVTDADGAPLADAEVEVVDQGWSTTTETDGSYAIGLPDGEFTLTFSAHGYTPQEHDLTIVDGAAQQLDVALEVGEAAALTGTITAAGAIGAGPATGEPIADAVVRVNGTPLQTTTDEQGHYSFDLVATGERELEIEAEGHVRTLHTFTMPDGAHTEDIAVLPTPTVGVVGDAASGAIAGRTKAFLEDWGYQGIDIDWAELGAFADVDLVVVNIESSGDPGEEGLIAFQDAANRAGVPVIWTGNYNRGSIRYLSNHQGDPEVWSGATNSGTVTTTVTEQHPLTTGLPEQFEGTEAGRMFGYFDDFSGTTVATIASEEDDHQGDAVAFRGRTADTVDVLLSAVNNSSYGALGTRTEAPVYLTEDSGRLMVNALQWSLEADGIGADAKGAVVDSAGQAVEATVTVTETGRTHPARAGDGSFVVPLEPGTWELTASAFGYTDASVEVTVEAGQSVSTEIVLPTAPGAAVTGQVTDSSGAAVAAAEVTVHDTDIVVTTDASGNYEVEHLPEGDWMLSAVAEQGRTRFADITVVDEQDVTQDFRLGARANVAVLGDRASDGIGPFLDANGFTTEVLAYNEMADLDLATGNYDLVIVNGTGTVPDDEDYLDFIDHAAEHDVSLIFASQWSSGSIRHLSALTGDPEEVSHAFRPEQIGYVVREAHPILDGIEPGDIITLLDNGTANQQYGSFVGYSGTVLADTVHPETEEVLDNGLGYRFATPSSVHVLLGSLAAGGYGTPGNRWTDNAERIYLNALDWAMLARQSQIYGTVTGAGDPLAGAEVSVVDTDLSTTTDAEGGYAIGVTPGEVTLRFTADGFIPTEETVEVDEEDEVELNVDLQPVASSSLTVQVVDDGTEQPISDAQVQVAGPTPGEGDTDSDGVIVFEPVSAGDYEIDVTASGYLPGVTEVTVTDEPAEIEVRLERLEVAVIGDHGTDLTDWLIEQEVPAGVLDWEEAEEAISGFRVGIVNGGPIDEAGFEAFIEAADAAGVPLVFTGTYGVDRGGIRLLEEFGDDVIVGGQGYRDGSVGIVDFDTEHPIFADLDDPAGVLADDSYYSWLSEYPGAELAVLTVGGQEAGTAVAHAERTDVSGHTLLSFAAVTEHLGPDRGWTSTTGQLLLNTLDWVTDVPLAMPTLEVEELVGETPVPVSGYAWGAETVQVLVDGEVVAEVTPDVDSSYSTTVDLVEGPNQVQVRAVAGEDSVDSAPVTVVLDTVAPDLDVVDPEDQRAYFDRVLVVSGTVTDEHAGVETVTVQGTEVEVAADGTFEAEITLPEGVSTVTVVAVDAVGHEAEETREVSYHPWTARTRVEVLPEGQAVVRLWLTDVRSTPVLADAAQVFLREADGDGEWGPYTMNHRDGHYVTSMRPPASGTLEVELRLDIDGHTAVLEAPDLTVP